jgi:hypothetical protein
MVRLFAGAAQTAPGQPSVLFGWVLALTPKEENSGYLGLTSLGSSPAHRPLFLFSRMKTCRPCAWAHPFFEILT